MRIYGRVYDVNGKPTWAVNSTDADGNNDIVYVTALAQVLLLNLNESPFYGNLGIPAAQVVIQQVFPDYYITLTQQAYAQYFASLLISRQNGLPPTYQVNIMTHQGVKINAKIPIPV